MKKIIILFIALLSICGASLDSQEIAPTTQTAPKTPPPVISASASDLPPEEIPPEGMDHTPSDPAKSETESKPKPESPPDAGPVVPDVKDPETVKLQEQLLILDKAKNTHELFQFIRNNYRQRNYKAASLAMAFSKTKYVTEPLQQECLAKWNHIIDRLDETAPRDFPQDRLWADRRFRTADASTVRLEFTKDANDCWQIGPASITQTDVIYEKVLNDRPFHGDWLSQKVPLWMFQLFCGLSYFQWAVLGIGFFLGILVYWIVQELLYLLMRAYMHVVYQDVTRQSRKVWKQVAAIAMAYVWFKTFSLVVLAPRLYVFVHYVFAIFATWMIVLITMRVIDLLAESLRIRFQSKFSEANLNNLIIPLFSRSMKTIAFCIAVISLAQAFRWPIVGVLSGMGLGGIAIAFAAKETVGNFFGSITVLIDKPFEIGDWIVTDGVEGTVEAVGMRSTRIRTFYNSVITIPNNNLVTAVIDNMGRRRYRRFRTFLTLQYENGPDRIEAFCEGVKELILKNPFTLKENFSVSMYNLQASSIDVLLNVFFVCPSTDTENRERAKLLKNILKLAEAMDVRFAYPTQTVYTNPDEAPPFRSLPEGNLPEIGRGFATKLLYPDPHVETEKR